MIVAFASQNPTQATPAPRTRETSSNAPVQHDAYIPRGSRMADDLLNGVGLAALAASTTALTSTILAGLGLTAAATVVGGVGGGILGEGIGNLTRRIARTSHSADAVEGNRFGGMVIGAGSGAVAGIASSIFGQSPLTAAITAATVVGIGSVAMALLDKSNK